MGIKGIRSIVRCHHPRLSLELFEHYAIVIKVLEDAKAKTKVAKRAAKESTCVFLKAF
jgi:hypothetical protein